MATESTHSHESHAGVGAPPPRYSDPAQESLVRALRASFNILRVLMVVLVALYLLSGVFRVEPGQQGLVARLGELRMARTDKGESPVFTQGWYWALPDPFDKKYLITGRVQELTVTTFMFNHPQAATAADLSQILPPMSALAPGVDGAMMTGDRNLSHGRWKVQYQIEDAALFVQHVGESPAAFEPLLERLTEMAVVREVAGRTIEEVTRTARDAVQQRVHDRLQASLADLATGVQVVKIVADTIEPGAVRQAFMDVLRAENEGLSLQERAREEATEVLSRTAGDKYDGLLDLIGQYGAAQLVDADEAELNRRLAGIDALLVAAKRDGAGQVAVKLSEAEARADQINESLRSEYKQFNDYLAQLKSQPRITLLNLWVAMRQEILSNRENEILFVPATQDIEIHIKNDAERKRELAEEEALMRQRSGL
jgi:membrane protease subunit HflK